tara:strand:- start:2597 stop:3073 length:477 start_codon:yes stop_codon:yes gene_type:complete
MTLEEIEQKVIGMQSQIDMLLRMLIERGGDQYSQFPNKRNQHISLDPPTKPEGFARDQLLASFSPKQVATVQLVVNGATTLEMAELLDCAESTAKVHIRGYMRKSNTTTRHKAAIHYKQLVEGLSGDKHYELTSVELDWAERPTYYKQTTSMLRQKVR